MSLLQSAVHRVSPTFWICLSDLCPDLECAVPTFVFGAIKINYSYYYFIFLNTSIHTDWISKSLPSRSLTDWMNDWFNHHYVLMEDQPLENYTRLIQESGDTTTRWNDFSTPSMSWRPWNLYERGINNVVEMVSLMDNGSC